jgi:hypothetical protein
MINSYLGLAAACPGYFARDRSVTEGDGPGTFDPEYAKAAADSVKRLSPATPSEKGERPQRRGDRSKVISA